MNAARSGLTGVIAALTAVVTVSAAQAGQPVWMDDAGLRAAFDGKSVRGIYRIGKPFAESYRADGSVSYAEDDGLRMSGSWSVQFGAFCTFYQDGQGSCFKVVASGANCYQMHPVTIPTVNEPARPLEPDWVAQVSVTGTPGTCGSGI
jgi:hypothetical protein